jgi:hypothetical protein
MGHQQPESIIELYRWLLRYGLDDERAHQALLELLAEEEGIATARVDKTKEPEPSQLKKDDKPLEGCIFFKG